MEIVSFELAKKLKEKGFREKCVNFYRNQTLTSHVMIFGPSARRNDKLSFNSMEFKLKDINESIQVNLIDAPTISQVLKWLREEKQIHIIVEISDSGWYYTIYPNIRWEDGKLKSDEYIMSFKHKSSFELAALAGIEYVLDNLI